MEDSMEDFIRISKNAEPLLKISNEVLMTIQRKKECEARALRIVEFLIDGKLRPEAFIHCLKYINQEQYQDIVEERAIVKLCGYCLCGKKLPEMPKQKYIISTKANKIYEITDRKNYCSNFCYKASLHIKDQIDTSPLWLRNFESSLNFNLLPASEIGIPGDEINQGIPKSALEPIFTSVSQFTEACLDEAEEIELTHKKVIKKKSKYRLSNPTMNTISENEEEEYDDESYDAAVVQQFNSENGLYMIEEPDEKKITNIQRHRKNIRKLRTPRISNKIDVILEETEQVAEQIAITNEIKQLTDCISDVKSQIKEKKKDISDVAKLANIRNKLQLNRPRQIKLIDAPISKQTEENNLKLSRTEQGIKSPENYSNRKAGDNKIDSAKASVSNDTEEKINAEINETFNKVKQYIQQWLTIETYLYIYGEERIKVILNEKKLLEYFDKLKIGETDTTKQMRYMNICKRLQLQELAEEKLDSILLEKNLKPLPNYKQLKEENKVVDLKVKSFYSGAMYEQPDTNFPTKPVKENEEVGPPAVLPLVDVSSQNALRRKVFLNSINRTVQNLAQELQLREQSVLSHISDLVRTFKLQAHNIVFKPAAWNLIAVILIHILGLKNEAIKRQLQSERCVRHVELLLSKFSGTDTFIQHLMIIIEDVDSYVECYIANNTTV